VRSKSLRSLGDISSWRFVKLYRRGGDSCDSLELREERRLDRRSGSGVRASDSRCAVGLTMMDCDLGMWLGGRRFGRAFAFLRRRSFLVLVTLVLICILDFAAGNWFAPILNWERERVIAFVKDMASSIIGTVVE